MSEKFQHRYRIHIVLFLLTLVTTTIAGTPDLGVYDSKHLALAVAEGLWFSIPLLVILSCHEFGHYLWCRRHDVDATLPYYLPAPPVILSGTFGAVIRIREPFPSKRALFDIGVAGPIGGFLALVPMLIVGVWMSQTGPALKDGALFFGEPLLYKAVAWFRFGSLPPGTDVYLHPLAFAAWFGMLVTSLNLLPFGQLDGGHIMYAVLGRYASRISAATVAVTALLTFYSASYFVTTVMMLVMAFFLGFRHPRIPDEDAPLDPGRKLIALFALVMFVLCFMPAPIELLGGK